MSQNWPISQLINKSSGTCSVCLATRQIHIRDGTLHKHGPRHDPCPGSNKPPLQAAVSQSSASNVNSACGSQDRSVKSVCPSADPNSRPPGVVPSTQSTSPAPFWSPDGATVIKRIPRSARHACASHLSSVLRKVVLNPDKSTLRQDLFNWGYTVLRTPKRGGKRHNLTATIKQRISSFAASQTDRSDLNSHTERRQANPKSSISQAVSAKLEDGNVRAAVRILMSHDSPAAPSQDSFKAMLEKHPPASSNLSDLPAPDPQQCLSVTEAEVRQAILSFPTGSAGGPDGMRPQQIRDLIMSREAGSDLLSAP